jgi:hypothetical protein
VAGNLVGREDDLKWLENQVGDILICGQPGSGKTSLLTTWAEANSALFVRSNDLTAIAAGVRSQRPSALILDDAHVDPDFTLKLRQVRQDVGASFRIIANTWPGGEDVLRTNLCLNPGAVREVGLLTRDKIVEVIKATGLVGPNALIHDIVGQAAGRPGLAVTLCHLCRYQGVRSVVLGEELAREVRATIGRLVGDRAIPLLAAFALGGATGMPRIEVANALGLPLIDLQTLTAQMAAGGVLQEAGERIIVVPSQLRYALVRDLFFKPNGLPLNSFLPLAPDQAEATRTLIHARGRGALVPDKLLCERLSKAAGSLLSLYVSLGPEEAKWALREHRKSLSEIAATGLRHAPVEYIGPLLDEIRIYVGSDSSRLKHALCPLAQLLQWIREPLPGDPAGLERRTLLLSEIEKWMDSGGDYEAGIHALCAAFRPDTHSSETDPGIGNTITLRDGLLVTADLEKLAAQWPCLLDRLDWTLLPSWKPIAEALDHWLTPPWVNPGLKAYDAAKELGRRMMESLVENAPEKLSIKRWVKQKSQRYRNRKHIEVPDDLEALYPARDFQTGKDEIRYRSKIAIALAIQWSKREPSEVTARWKWLILEMKTSGLQQWDQNKDVALHLGKAVPTERLLEWCTALKSASLTQEYLHSFVPRLIILRPEGWDSFIFDCLDSVDYAAVATAALLAQAKSPPAMIARCMDRVVDFPQTVYHLCLRGEIAAPFLRSLLLHSDREVSGAAASGMWGARPEKTISPDLQKTWEAAVIKHLRGSERELKDIVQQLPELGELWLQERLRTSTLQSSCSDREPAAILLTLLPVDRREKLFGYMESGNFSDEFLDALIGQDSVLFDALLNRESLSHLHTIPLHGLPRPVWIERARIALQLGWEPERIIHAAASGSQSSSGPLSDYLGKWEQAFLNLEAEAPDLKAVARYGAEMFRKRKEKCLRSELHVAVFGSEY